MRRRAQRELTKRKVVCWVRLLTSRAMRGPREPGRGSVRASGLPNGRAGRSEGTPPHGASIPHASGERPGPTQPPYRTPYPDGARTGYRPGPGRGACAQVPGLACGRSNRSAQRAPQHFRIVSRRIEACRTFRDFPHDHVLGPRRDVAFFCEWLFFGRHLEPSPKPSGGAGQFGTRDRPKRSNPAYRPAPRSTPFDYERRDRKRPFSRQPHCRLHDLALDLQGPPRRFNEALAEWVFRSASRLAVRGHRRTQLGLELPIWLWRPTS